MNAVPLVTIGIPVYNEENYLAQTIESAINQTYKNIQIIISDNCSTDSSFEIAQRYAQKDSRILLVKQEKNIGPLENFKFVLEKATSEYFCWLGAHDIFINDYIQGAVELLESDGKIMMVYPLVTSMDQFSNKLSSSNDDIDTKNLILSDRLCKVATNLYYCFAIHGLFKTQIAKKLPFKKTISSDHLLLFCTAFYGDIRQIQQVGLYARQVREETFEESKLRYQSMGLFKSKTSQNPHARMAFYHYTFLLGNISPLTILNTIKILKKLQHIFAKRFGVKTKEVRKIFYSYFNPFHQK